MVRKRELIDTGTDKRYVRRNKLGTSFVESDDVGRSRAADRRKRSFGTEQGFASTSDREKTRCGIVSARTTASMSAASDTAFITLRL